MREKLLLFLNQTEDENINSIIWDVVGRIFPIHATHIAGIKARLKP